jgi:hypothetical protein
MKIAKKILIFVSVVPALVQFFGPKKNDGGMATVPVFLAETNLSEDIKKILETTYFDCHSSKTFYPWYNAITPVNYSLEENIKEGQKHLNFSNLDAYSLEKKEHKIEELYEEVTEREMPLNSDTWLHADANLTTTQIAAVVTWGKKVQADYKQQMSIQ